MFKTINGNLFDQNLESYCHGCNVFGKMYAGIANQFRIRYPEMFEQYKLGCSKKLFQPGDVFHYQDLATNKHIFNLFSQSYPGPYAKLEWLKQSLSETLNLCQSLGVNSLGSPLIGGGIGGLDPKEVLKIFEELGNMSSVNVVVCIL